MANKPTSEHYCPGCGRDTRESDEPIAQIKIGQYVTSGDGRQVFKLSETYGEMHESCFLLAIGDPEGVEKMAKVAYR